MGLKSEVSGLKSCVLIGSAKKCLTCLLLMSII
jgi:hypothetical protein